MVEINIAKIDVTAKFVIKLTAQTTGFVYLGLTSVLF